MTLTTVICGYIYAGFLVIQAALEAGLLYAKAIIKSIDSLVLAVENMIRLTCLAVLDAALNAYQVLCKYLVDWLMQRTNADKLLDKFCKSIFKCSYILKELLNPASPITKVLVKNAEYDAAAQVALYQDLTTFDEFRKQICSNGFTFVWGLTWLRDKGEAILAQINEWVDIITRNRNRIRKKLESYFYAIEDYGILDLLEQLSQFFNCVLSNDDESCAAIATSQNFYKKCTGALHVRKIGRGRQFKLTDSWVTQQLGTCDKVSKELNAVKNNLAIALTDAGLTSKNIANAQAAFNLANFIRDTKRAIDNDAWCRIPGVKLFQHTYNDTVEFGQALGSAINKLINNGHVDPETPTIDSIDLSFDSILDQARFNDENHLIIKVNNTNVDITDILPTGVPIVVKDDIFVQQAQADISADSINRLYWTEDYTLTTVGTVALAKLAVDNGTATEEEQRLAKDLADKMSVINALSDTTNVTIRY